MFKNVKGVRVFESSTHIFKRLVDSEDWVEEASCYGINDPDLFFRPGDEETAALICDSCPVKTRCLAKGVKTASEGTWGGMALVGGRVVKGITEAAEMRKGTADQKYLPLWERGLSDIQIARSRGVNRSCVSSWRKSRGLKPKGQGEK